MSKDVCRCGGPPRNGSICQSLANATSIASNYVPANFNDTIVFFFRKKPPLVSTHHLRHTTIMAADDLAQMYHERWQTANHRIFELEVMLRDRNKEIAAYQSKIIAGDSSNESRAHLSDIKTEAAAQMQAKDKELARLQEQIRDRDMQVLRLQQQLDLKKATIAKARKAIEGRSLNPIASLLRAPMGDEGGINRAR